MSVETSLAIGYGLAVVMYGGYWGYLISKKNRVMKIAASMQANNEK